MYPSLRGLAKYARYWLIGMPRRLRGEYLKVAYTEGAASQAAESLPRRSERMLPQAQGKSRATFHWEGDSLALVTSMNNQTLKRCLRALRLILG